MPDFNVSKSKSFFTKYADPLKEEIKRCENILQKKTNAASFKLTFKDVLNKRKNRMKKKVKNQFLDKVI